MIHLILKQKHLGILCLKGCKFDFSDNFSIVFIQARNMQVTFV